MDVIYLDFKKAFDKVPHRRLLSKIRAHGVKVLGLQLFTLYINDQDEGTEGILAKCVDDTKIDRATGSIEEAGRLQKDLDRLAQWAKWQMEYNMGKCEVMHFDKKNRSMGYFLNGEKIQKSEGQRDLRVVIQDSLK
eukprot:g16407.t1